MIKLLGFASIHLRPISDHVMLTVGRSARDLLRRRSHSSSKEQKKPSELQIQRGRGLATEGRQVLFTHQFWHHHLVHGTMPLRPASKGLPQYPCRKPTVSLLAPACQHLPVLEPIYSPTIKPTLASPTLKWPEFAPTS